MPTVVLVLSTFTCNIFCEQAVHLRRLHEARGEDAAFLFVYISDAPQHKLPGFLQRIADESDPADPKAKRLRIIQEGMRHFRLSFPCLLDTEDKS